MKLFRNTFVNMFLISIIAVIAGVLLSYYSTPQHTDLGLPWQIETTADGSSRIFQIHLGNTTLHQAEVLFNETAEITLFAPRDQQAVIEAYFNDISIAGLKAKLVVTLDLSQDTINDIFNRGERISTMGSGTRKVTLSDTDANMVRNTAITTLTYIPAVNLDAELIQKRFGKPNSIIKENDAEHWLYPEKGLDVILNQNAKEVLQYTLPKDFDKILQPLQTKTDTH
ncbi:MAG: hypothetical protein EP315_06820 [Gammaproteobacteria bacterium]|nr:MAG: hypothetical protein EP315_06820 [Gammaproteobacteria bacterium]